MTLRIAGQPIGCEANPCVIVDIRWRVGFCAELFYRAERLG